MGKTHLAVYGNTTMVRAYCAACEGWALVIRGKLACCDSGHSESPRKVKRMSQAAYVRYRPSREAQARLLEEYGHCCAYCDARFGSLREFRGRLQAVTLNWDHNVPWCYSMDNRDSNFVPACSRCNLWKSSLMFTSLEQARIYIAAKLDAEK